MKYDPTDVEPRFLRSRFCEIGSIGSIISGAVGLFSGLSSADAAEDASDAQVRAALIAADVQREGLDFTREVYDVGRADYSPYRASGTGALQTMNNMFLPGGHEMVQMQGRLNELRAQQAREQSAARAAASRPAPPPPAPALAPGGVTADGGGGESSGPGGGPGDADSSGSERGGSEGPSGGGTAGSDPGGTGGGGRDSGPGGFHKGGSVTDYDPQTHKNNMLINAQEGEVVMSRNAVKMMGRNFLLKANERANRRAT